jgi:hypothetical protein
MSATGTRPHWDFKLESKGEGELSLVVRRRGANFYQAFPITADQLRDLNLPTKTKGSA